jgi:hypothetical protein
MGVNIIVRFLAYLQYAHFILITPSSVYVAEIVQDPALVVQVLRSEQCQGRVVVSHGLVLARFPFRLACKERGIIIVYF